MCIPLKLPKLFQKFVVSDPICAVRFYFFHRLLKNRVEIILSAGKRAKTLFFRVKQSRTSDNEDLYQMTSTKIQSHARALREVSENLPALNSK